MTEIRCTSLIDVGAYHSNTFLVRNPVQFKTWLDRWDMVYKLNLTDGIGKTSEADVMLLNAEHPLQVTLSIRDEKPRLVMDDLLGTCVYNPKFLEELSLFLVQDTAALFQQIDFTAGQVRIGYVEVVNWNGSILRTNMTDLIPSLQRREEVYNFVDSSAQREVTYYAHIGKPMIPSYRHPTEIIHRLLMLHDKVLPAYEPDELPQLLVDRDCKVILVFPKIELVSGFISLIQKYLNWYPLFNGRRIMLHERLTEESLLDFMRLFVLYNRVEAEPFSEIQDLVDNENIREVENFTPHTQYSRIYFALYRSKVIPDAETIARIASALIRTPLGDYAYTYNDIK